MTERRAFFESESAELEVEVAQMSQLEGTLTEVDAQLEEDASAVMFLYRPAYYLELQGQLDDIDKEMIRQRSLEATRNTLEIIVAKNRNGRTGNITQFVNIGANAIRPMSFGGH